MAQVTPKTEFAQSSHVTLLKVIYFAIDIWNVQAGRAEGSADTTLAIPRLDRIPRRMPHGNQRYYDNTEDGSMSGKHQGVGDYSKSKGPMAMTILQVPLVLQPLESFDHGLLWRTSESCCPGARTRPSIQKQMCAYKKLSA